MDTNDSTHVLSLLEKLSQSVESISANMKSMQAKVDQQETRLLENMFSQPIPDSDGKPGKKEQIYTPLSKQDSLDTAARLTKKLSAIDPKKGHNPTRFPFLDEMRAAFMRQGGIAITNRHQDKAERDTHNFLCHGRYQSLTIPTTVYQLRIAGFKVVIVPLDDKD